MKYLFSALILLLNLALGALPAHAQQSCVDLFAFAEWQSSGVLIPSPFQARNFLPQDYLAEVESRVGSLKFEVTAFDGFDSPTSLKDILIPDRDPKELLKNKKDYFSVQIAAQSADAKFKATFEFIFLKNDKTKVLLNNLSIWDSSLATQSPHHQTQTARGASLPVLRRSLDQIFSFLRKRGIQSVEASAATDYTVSLLYRKFLGFKPSTTEATDVYAAFDHTYRNSKSLPEAVRPKSVDDFSRSLGSIKSNDENFRRAADQLHLYLQKRPVESDIDVILNSENQPIALVMDRNASEPRVFYVDPITHSGILVWQAAYKNDWMRLSRSARPL